MAHRLVGTMLRRLRSVTRHLVTTPVATDDGRKTLSATRHLVTTPVASDDGRKTLLFNRSSFASSLSMADYIAAVERVHTAHADGSTLETGLVHADAPQGEVRVSGKMLQLCLYFFSICSSISRLAGSWETKELVTMD